MGSICKEYCVIVDKKTEGIRKGSVYEGEDWIGCGYGLQKRDCLPGS